VSTLIVRSPLQSSVGQLPGTGVPFYLVAAGIMSGTADPNPGTPYT